LSGERGEMAAGKKTTASKSSAKKSATKKSSGKIAGVPQVEKPNRSIKGMPGVTENRTATERRIGSGNTRRGSAANKKAVGEL
jgi:hypothetical protein